MELGAASERSTRGSRAVQEGGTRPHSLCREGGGHAARITPAAHRVKRLLDTRFLAQILAAGGQSRFEAGRGSETTNRFFARMLQGTCVGGRASARQGGAWREERRITTREFTSSVLERKRAVGSWDRRDSTMTLVRVQRGGARAAEGGGVIGTPLWL